MPSILDLATTPQDGRIVSTSGVLSRLTTGVTAISNISSSSGDVEARVAWFFHTSGLLRRLISAVEFWAYISTNTDDLITYYQFLIGSSLGPTLDATDSDFNSLLSTGRVFAEYSTGAPLPLSPGWLQIGSLTPADLNFDGYTNIMCDPNATDITDGGFLSFRMSEFTGGIFGAFLRLTVEDPSFERTKILRPAIFKPSGPRFGVNVI